MVKRFSEIQKVYRHWGELQFHPYQCQYVRSVIDSSFINISFLIASLLLNFDLVEYSYQTLLVSTDMYPFYSFSSDAWMMEIPYYYIWSWSSQTQGTCTHPVRAMLRWPLESTSVPGELSCPYPICKVRLGLRNAHHSILQHMTSAAKWQDLWWRVETLKRCLTADVEFMEHGWYPVLWRMVKIDGYPLNI